MPQTLHTGLDDGLHGPSAAWRNWSGSQQATPAAKWLPQDEDDLRRLLREAGSVRVVGAGHSFSPLVPTKGALVSLDRLSGLIDHDVQAMRARAWAGTRLFELGSLLHSVGQSMPNLGDVDRQSLAGAVATATHGTGIGLPCLAAGATALRLVSAEGEVLECSRERDAELFRAAAVSLGLLGVITQVSLQNEVAFRLHERVRVEPLDGLLPAIASRATAHRSFELWAFPHARQAIVKTLDIAETQPSSAAHGADSDDFALLLGCELTRRLPALGRWLERVLGRIVRPSERSDWSHMIYPSARNVRFNEMEYQVPAALGPACLDEVCRAVAASGIVVFIPIEFRLVAADDFWLSPFQGEPGQARCSISIHQYHKQDYRPLFTVVEPILRRYQGRPHWGKLHSLQGPQLHELYPELARFLRLRGELDPHGKFLTPHLRELFGIAAS